MVFLCLPAQINRQVRICYTILLHIENSLDVLGTVLETIAIAYYLLLH